ncbi:hypothetical protein IFR04_016072 [Cadophora malorum]|uniref:Phosphatidylglycerol/phosphatidylinositol transfer protein n=1 Tax=Cadophora malorum TaxID=108018 RepID=A0A8H7T1Z7_9HELO|nr:hypothetical protein IFR04_016072 [Cadophora malorum]
MHVMLAPFSLITRALPRTKWHQEPLDTEVVEHGDRGLPSVIPGGSPFSYCNVSQGTDLFNISSITLWPQPLYINDDFIITVYGELSKNITANSTMNLWLDCGSHCEEYGAEPGSGEGDSIEFCDVTDVQQPNKRQGCPMEKGGAILSYEFFVWDMFLHQPLWYNFTFDMRTKEGERMFCVTSEVCLKWHNEDKNKHYPGGPYPYCEWPR